MSEPDIILTENAAKRVAWIAARQSKPAVLRLAVDGGGCAGFTYKFDLADGAEAQDAVAETDGVKLVVDPVSLELVKRIGGRFRRGPRRRGVQGDQPQRPVGLRLRVELQRLPSFGAHPASCGSDC